MKKTVNFHFGNYSMPDLGEIALCGDRILLYEDIMDDSVNYDELFARAMLFKEYDIYFSMTENDDPKGFRRYQPGIFKYIRRCRLIFDPEFFITDDGFSVVFEAPREIKINLVRRLIIEGLKF